MENKESLEDLIAMITGDAKSIRTLLEDMMEWSEPDRMNALQVIVEHQIGCCRELEEKVLRRQIESQCCEE